MPTADRPATQRLRETPCFHILAPPSRTRVSAPYGPRYNSVNGSGSRDHASVTGLTRFPTAIILHGDAAPTDRNQRPHGHEVPRPDEEDAGQPADDDLEIVKSLRYSLHFHAGQSRASGEPYLVHPLEVALVLAEMKMDPVAVAAGLLPIRSRTLRSRSSTSARNSASRSHIVEGVTKISKIDFATRKSSRPRTCAR